VRSDCTHLATDVTLLEDKGLARHKEQPNLHPTKNPVVISYDEDSPKPSTNHRHQSPVARGNPIHNLSYNSQNPEVPWKNWPRYRPTIKNRQGHTRSLRWTWNPTPSRRFCRKILEKSDQFQLRLLSKDRFGERGSCYGYRHIVLTGNARDSAEETYRCSGRTRAESITQSWPPPSWNLSVKTTQLA